MCFFQKDNPAWRAVLFNLCPLINQAMRIHHYGYLYFFIPFRKQSSVRQPVTAKKMFELLLNIKPTHYGHKEKLPDEKEALANWIIMVPETERASTRKHSALTITNERN